VQFDGRRDHQHDRREQDQRAGRKDEIERGLDDQLRASKRRLDDVHQREVGDVAHQHPGSRDIRDRRSERQPDAGTFQFPGQTTDIVGPEILGCGDRDHAGSGLPDRCHHVIEIAQNGKATHFLGTSEMHGRAAR